MKGIKRIIHPAFALILAFSIMAISSENVFALPESDSVSVSGYTFRGYVYFGSDKISGIAVSNFSVISGITTEVYTRYYYNKEKVTSYSYAKNSNASTSVSAIATRKPAHSNLCFVYEVEGIHKLSYETSPRKLNTEVYRNWY